MNKTIIVLILVFISITSCSTSYLQKPTKKEVASSQTEIDLLKEGILYHDSKDYDRAIAKYKEVLKINPANCNVYYEIASSYFHSRDFQNAIKYCKLGLEFESEYYPDIAMMYANIVDMQGFPLNAIKIYEDALKYTNNNYMLYFNYGITNQGLKKYDVAENAYSQALKINPFHPGSLNAFSYLHQSKNENIEALLTSLRFLTLENTGDRAKSNLNVILNELDVKEKIDKTGKKSYTINLSLTNSQKDSDLGGIEIFWGVMKMGPLTINPEFNKDSLLSKGKDTFGIEMKQYSEIFKRFFKYLAADKYSKKLDSKNYTFSFLIPYFAELEKEGHTEAFTYFIMQETDKDGIMTYFKNNKENVKKFLDWSYNYALEKQKEFQKK